jgi:hypothetical protein
MKKQDLEQLKAWFSDHVAGFYGDDKFVNNHIKLKEEHTDNVCTEMNELTEKLGLDENDRLIAETIALLHDVGRFTQFKIYNTYSDPKSVNHSQLSLDIIRQNGLLDTLDANEQRIIKTAIKLHSQKNIPADLDSAIVPFAKLIRDTDKLDIYPLLVKYYKLYLANPDEFPLEVEMPDEPYYCPEIYDSVLNGRLVDYTKLKTLNDIKILKIGWVYDINFSAALEKISDNHYLDELFGLLPDDEKIKKLRTVVLKYIDQRIAAGI